MVVRSLLFISSLFLVALFELHPLALFLFLIMAIYLMLKPLDQPFFLALFFFLTLLSLWSIHFVENIFLLSTYLIIFGCVFLLLQVVRRWPDALYRFYFLSLGILLIYFIGSLFYIGQGSIGYTREIVLGIVVFALMFELLLFMRPYSSHELTIKTVKMISAVYAVISIELFWVLSLLPIGFLNLAALFALIFFFALDIIRHYLNSSLSHVLLLKHMTMFTIVFVVIMGLSRWSI